MNERTIFQAMSRRHVISLAPAATVHEAAYVMTRANCGSWPRRWTQPPRR